MQCSIPSNSPASMRVWLDKSLGLLEDCSLIYSPVGWQVCPVCRFFETLSYLPPLSVDQIAKQVCFWFPPSCHIMYSLLRRFSMDSGVPMVWPCRGSRLEKLANQFAMSVTLKLSYKILIGNTSVCRDNQINIIFMWHLWHAIKESSEVQLEFKLSPHVQREKCSLSDSEFYMVWGRWFVVDRHLSVVNNLVLI